MEEERIISVMEMIKRFGVLLVVFAILQTACSKNEKAVAVESGEELKMKQMDAFHLILTEAYHPYTDSANLKPVRLLAEEMAMQAKALASDSLQEKLNSDVTTLQLEKLRDECRTLARLVRNAATDKEIVSVLDTLNNTFHIIMENWKNEAHNH
jgi:hypothetical protein